MGIARMLARSLLSAALLLALPNAADATSLDVLEGTSHGVGLLVFDFTKVEIAGPLDPSQIDVNVSFFADGLGFDVTPLVPGAISATNGGIADIKLEFTVTAITPIGVIRAGNHLIAAVAGDGSSASVSELIDEAPGVDLGVFVAAFGSLPDNEQDLGATLFTLHVTKNIVVAADDLGTAEVTKLSQRFLVPEPTTAGLLLIGFSGLAWSGRRR